MDIVQMKAKDSQASSVVIVRTNDWGPSPIAF